MNWQTFSKSSAAGVIIYGGTENYNFSDGRKVMFYKSIVF